MAEAPAPAAPSKDGSSSDYFYYIMLAIVGGSLLWGISNPGSNYQYKDEDDGVIDGKYCTGEMTEVRGDDGMNISIPLCYDVDVTQYNAEQGVTILDKPDSRRWNFAGIFTSIFGSQGKDIDGDGVIDKGSSKPNFIDRLSNFTLFQMYPGVMTLLYLLNIALIFIVMNLMSRAKKVIKSMNATVEVPNPNDLESSVPIKQTLSGSQNARWEEVLRLLETNTESLWRMAILDADIMLGDMLTVLGYSGDIGTQLKSADPNQFHSLNEAWTAHKVRNKIAHEGQEFKISHEQARATIELFEIVFREWEYI